MAHTRLVIVDNDPERSAEPVVSCVQDERLEYTSEPTPGISAARNRILDLAGNAELLAFIDDDETPGPGWLRSLVQTWRSTGADGVAGPVVSVPTGPLHPWVEAGEFFDRTHWEGVPTGTQIARAATNNLLLDLRTIHRLGLRFDPRFGLSGGEDSVFTGTLVNGGGRLVWCAESVVFDHLPSERLTPQYALERTYGLAHSSSRAELALADSLSRRTALRVRLVFSAATRLALGEAQFVRGVVWGRLGDRALGRRMVARGRGEFSAVLGRTSRPYARGDATSRAR